MTMEGVLVVGIGLGIIGVAIFLMVMDISRWKRKEPRGFEVGQERARKK